MTNPRATIIELSHRFGVPEYVQGGGGNTSAKDAAWLWIKPSGTTLCDLAEADLVTLDRARVEALFDAEAPVETRARERFAKAALDAAVVPPGSGRPSVESPLHHAFAATFVVHTHPALVNGLTCARDGEATCRRLFPDALWIDYVDPGYTLSVAARKAIRTFAAAHGGREPRVVFQQNHGVFVAGDTDTAIRESYAALMDTLRRAYAAAGVATACATPPVDQDRAADAIPRLRALLGANGAAVTCGGAFTPPAGPVTPDHIVYMKSYALTDPLTPETVAAFERQHGYLPRILVVDGQVYAAGPNEKVMRLALTFARDAERVVQLAAAFGGIRYMTDRAREFVENWEVESYRQKVAFAAR